MIGRFVVKRLAIALLQLIGVALVVFFLIRMLPADPVARLVGLNASEDAYRQSAHALGRRSAAVAATRQLPWRVFQLAAEWALQGNLGVSWVTNTPVLTEIREVLPITLEIVTYSLLIAFLIALPLGLASARKPGGVADRITLIWGMFAGAQPDYWWGLLFVFIFYFLLNVAPPPMGRLDPLIVQPLQHHRFPDDRHAAAGAFRRVSQRRASSDAAGFDARLCGVRRDR